MKTIINQITFILLLFVTQLSAQDTTTWYKVTEVADNTWLIDDNGNDNIYLVEGKDSALLIDTGIGVADLISTVKKITDKPLIMVVTHGHPDHAGANYQFEKVYAHQNDFDAVKMFGNVSTSKSTLRSMAEEDRPAEKRRFNSKAKKTVLLPVSDGYIFDLGGRKIQVMETPGHTPGGICLMDIKNKLLFSGDNNNSLVWLFLDGCLPLSEYLKTLEMQVLRINEFTTLYPGHGPAMSSNFIKEQIECVKAILDESCESEPYHSFAGESKICKHGNAQVAYNPDNL
ncbi:MAG: MBL fold metallo-hydrolase [Mariniphaga sp.]|nr:MBL fold metallo-hydrolase [Mariniphaga sp.]